MAGDAAGALRMPVETGKSARDGMTATTGSGGAPPASMTTVASA
jgi:hypothetical protein